MTHRLVHTIDPDAIDLGRRRLLKTGAAGAAIGLLGTACAEEGPAAGDDPSALPSLPAGAAADESYWRAVKDQFALAPGIRMMNAANLCPSPRVVTRALFEHTRDVDADPSFQNRAKYGDLREEARRKLAAFMGAEAEEIALVRNTSEGNNMVVNGLDLGPGDEVIVWKQNHESNSWAWDLRAERYGFSVIYVTVPEQPDSPDDLYRAFIGAVTERTKVLAFSHVSNLSGIHLPARRLCAFARDNGIISLVDGAQVIGAQPLDVHELGCDFYTASLHKWPMGPRETGVFYVRADWIDRLWPTRLTHGWDVESVSGARRFESLGQRDIARFPAISAAIDFYRRVGKARIESRIAQLAQALKDGIQAARPDAGFVTPLDPAMSSGIVIIKIDGLARETAASALYEDHFIAAAVFGDETFAGIRLCPHAYTTKADIEAVIEAVGAL